MYQIKATNTKTLEMLLFHNLYETTEDARLAIDHDIEWDEDDIQEDWKFEIVKTEDEYEEPADIDDDRGFDPYCGCYTYDCQGVATMRDLFKIVVWFFVINFSICNQIWTEPVSYWWIIEIIVLIISILMVDKQVKKQYYNYRNKEREEKKMFVRINYSNDYCGCNQSEVLEVENIEEAKVYAEEAIYDYAESYTYVATGWDEGFESEEEEEAYYDNCTFYIEEITEEEYQEEK